ncbi:alpha/beta hydrolase [Nocardia panacis]|nr:alpha/beta hydrolase [Nocardia panacis]
MAGIAGLVAAMTACSSSAPKDPPRGSSIADLVAQADAAPTPTLAWEPCAAPLVGKVCATAQVPIDYAKPDGPKLGLAVLKQPAKDPAHRIGTLFTASGGPGGSGFEDAAGGEILPGPLAERFDIVTFDQRGIGRSGKIRCFPNDEAAQQFWSRATLPPVNAEQERATEALSREFAAACGANAGELLAHVTTADAARDMDLLRRAVGDAKLTYEGGSYASYLGEVYGALFGERVRALQLTAMIDPDGYTNDSIARQRDSALGTEQTAAEFLRQCALAGRDRCAFGAEPGADPTAITARNKAVLDKVRQGGVTVGHGEQARTFSATKIMAANTGLLYNSYEGWDELAQLMVNLERGAEGDPALVAGLIEGPANEYQPDFMAAFSAITCADAPVPRDPGIWPEKAREFAKDAPNYGPYWFYLVQSCASWPSPAQGYPQRFTGPWKFHNETPALLINNRFDPITSLAFAQAAEQQLGNARLVVTEGAGHTPPGTCYQRIRDEYLIDLRVPPAGFTCTPERKPFSE